MKKIAIHTRTIPDEFIGVFLTSGYKFLAHAIVFFFLQILLSAPLFGQNKSVYFQSLQQGLSNSHVKCILKDHKGYMWFGTPDGLNRFDGTSFVLYENNPSDSTSLSHNAVNTIIEDKYGTLWIGTANGLTRYNRDTDNFTKVKAFGDRDIFYVSCLWYDKKATLWIGTAGNGLYSYDLESDKAISYDQATPHFINSITGYRNYIWIGTRDGLCRYQKNTKTFRRYVHEPDNEKSLSTNQIQSLTVDHNQNLWIATYGGGINKLSLSEQEPTFSRYLSSDPQGLSHNSVIALCKDRKGNLWVGTENGGLNYLDIQSETFTHFKSNDGYDGTLSDNSIWSIYEDNTGILWIGTRSKGVNIIDKEFNRFKTLKRNSFSKKTLVNNDVHAFALDKEKKLWIGTDGGGLSVFDLKSNQFVSSFDNSKLSSQSVMTLLMDSKNNLWVGTWSGGIDRVSKGRQIIKNYKNGSCSSNNILAIYEDSKERIWAGTSGGGLFLYNPLSDQFLSIIDDTESTHLTKTAFVGKILEDQKSRIWVCTLFGLICIQESEDGDFLFSEFAHSEAPGSISSFAVQTIYEDSKKNLWIGTEDGLNLFNEADRSFTVFNKSSGLPGNVILCIEEDESGYLWLGTNHGLAKFDPEANTFFNFNQQDGLASNDFNVRSSIKATNGRLFFGSNNGINMFYPDSIRPNQHIPPVYITELELFNKPVKVGVENSPLKNNISEAQSITLNHEQSSFTLQYVALNYTRSTKNRYAYKLEGFEEHWNYVGSRQRATYTNLDPGTYVFKVKGSNNDGVWSEVPAELEIILEPPYWETGWAYLIYILTISLILFVFIKLLILQARQAQRLRIEQMNHEKDEELNNLKIQFFTNISHELRTPLSLIISPLEEAISSRSIRRDTLYKLNMVLGNARKMVRLVNELMDFTKSETNRLKMVVQKGNIVRFSREIFLLFTDQAERRQIKYEFVADTEGIEAWFDKNKLEKIINNLIANSFKYTADGGNILVKVGLVTDTPDSPMKDSIGPHQSISISVTDDGSGISPEYLNKVFDRFFQSPEEDNTSHAGTGIGLALSKNLVELHHGKIQVTSEKWKQTCFKVTLPLGNTHFDENEIILKQTESSSDGTRFSYKMRPRASKKQTSKEKPLLLVVEDNPELREYIISVLSSDYKILEAPNGKIGCEIAIKRVPDLIISDIIMPELNGTNLCQQLKDNIFTSHIPVILLTSKATTNDKIEGMETGADAYIIKPFNVTHLKVTIRKLVENRRMLLKRFSQEAYLFPREVSTNELDEKFLNQIIEYVHENIYDSDTTVESMAAHLGMNRSNFYRKIKFLTGKSASEFIRTIRLKMALKHLESGAYNVSEIAFKVGFESPWYFAKCFKKQFGKSPSKYLPEKQ